MKISKGVLAMVVLLVFIVSFILGYVVSMQFAAKDVESAEVAQIEYPELDVVEEVEPVVVEEEPGIERGSLFVDEAGVFIAYPSKFEVRERDGDHGDLLSYRLSDGEKVKDELIVEIDVATMESVKIAADNYMEGSVFCIDHGVCDEDFDSQDFVKAFNNLKSVTVGNGEQVELSSDLFLQMTSGYYDETNHDLLTINGRKFVVNNMSSVPGGMVWRNYTTFVNDVRVTISVSWGFDRKEEGIMHKFDAAADAIAEEVLLGGGVG